MHETKRFSMNGIWSFFAFPLNALCAILWFVSFAILRKKYPGSTVMRFLLSSTATISSISLLILCCLWIGLTADRSFIGSLIFILILLYIQTVLFLITLRGVRHADGSIRWRFIFLHAGLLLAVASTFWGSPDSNEFRMKIRCGETSREAYSLDSRKVQLEYEISLIDLNPVHYCADISIDGHEFATICVNSPYHVRFGEDIYLASTSDDTCVLQIVREPWRYFTLAGVILMLCGAFLLFINGPRKR